MHDCRGAMQYSITVSLVLEVVSSYIVPKGICPSGLSGILLPLLCCYVVVLILVLHPYSRSTCHCPVLDSRYPIRTPIKQTMADENNWNVGRLLAHRITELGVHDFFVVPGLLPWCLYSCATMANQKQATTI